MTAHVETDATVERTHYAPGYRSRWHRHRHAQVIYPSTGVMRIHTKRGLWVVPPLRACWLLPSEPHRIETSGALQMHSVYCKSPLLRRLPERCGIVSVTGLLRELILNLEEASRDQRHEDAANRVAQVIPDQVSLIEAAQLPPPSVLSKRLQPIQTALSADPADKRTLRTWSDELGVASRTLARAFERDARMSFSAYRQQMRLHVAVERLAQGQAVTRIAYDLGFSSPSNFIAVFRRATGKTPGAYFA